MFKYLNWDSHFFHKKIAKITCLENEHLSDLISDLSYFRKNNYDCAYINVSKSKKDIIQYCKKNKIPRVKIHVQLFKTIKKNSYTPHVQISSSLSGSYKPDIYELSHQLAQISRFYKDKKFRPFVNKLYEKWMYNSIFNNSSKAYFCATEKNRAIGIITIKIKKRYPFIDLFVIDKTHRRQGIGTSLIQAAEHWAYKNKYKNLSVVTQKENRAALGMYKRNRFRLTSISYMYHLWQ